MESYGIGQFEQLLESEYQTNVIAAMFEWCESGPVSAALGLSLSRLVREDIANPLWQWVGDAKQARRPGNFSDLTAAEQFAVCADDLAYKLEARRRPYPEHIKQLSDAWQAFQRERAFHAQIEGRLMRHGFSGADLEKERLLAIEAVEIKRKEQILEWQTQGAAASVKYSDEAKQNWLIDAAALKSVNQGLSARGMAEKIAAKFGLPDTAIETIRKHIAANGFKRNG